MPAHEIAVRRHATAEVLRPGLVGRAVDDDVTDFLRPRFLRDRRKSHDRIHLFRGELRQLLVQRADHPLDVALRIQSDLRRHRGEEHVLGRAFRRDRHQLALEIAHGLHAVRGNQFEAAGMDPREHQGGKPRLDVKHRGGHIADEDIHFALGHRRGRRSAACAADVLHIGEAFGAQQILGDELRREADARGPGQPDAGRFGRRLGSAQRAAPGTQTGSAACR